MKNQRLLLFFLTMSASLCGWSYDFEKDGIYYNILSEQDKTVEVTFAHEYTDGRGQKRYDCTKKSDVVIPTEVNGYSVVSIGKHTFDDKDLTSIVIPNSIKFIDDYAFKESDINDITMPNSITSIGIGVFENCKITSITLSNNLTEINDYAFYKCTKLQTISLPQNLKSIGDHSFEGCCFNTIVFPESLTHIGESAFYDCNALSSINISQNITSIGDKAFANCSNITTITVDENNIVYDSRNNCNCIIETATNTIVHGCKNSIIPDDVVSIGDYAFYHCQDLESITIPNGITNIGRAAFYNCEKLTSIRMPEGVISIGEYAFSRCEVLSTISIPNSVSIIGCNAFSYTKIRGISIPKNVTRIEGQTFGNCTLLSSLTIPSNVTDLDANAFFGCKSLTNIYNYSETPQRIFSNTFATYGTLHVPNGQKEAYMKAEYWKNFNIYDDIRTYNAIDTITNVEDKDSSIYTLDGRLVNDVPKAGIYIKDGKKRIIQRK